jgi:hypothetical protein
MAALERAPTRGPWRSSSGWGRQAARGRVVRPVRPRDDRGVPDIEEVAIILDAARALRAYLPELVGPDRAAPLDRELAELLERPGDEDVPDRLAAIFEREERVHVWVAEYFTYGAPGDVAETERVAPLPGAP